MAEASSCAVILALNSAAALKSPALLNRHCQPSSL